MTNNCCWRGRASVSRVKSAVCETLNKILWHLLCHMLWNCCWRQTRRNSVIHSKLFEQWVNGKKGEKAKRERRTEHGWRCRRWWQAQLQSLIASGNRSHFPNHIHEPLIYFHPLSLTFSLSLSPISVSLSCSMGCSEFIILLSCRMFRACQACILKDMELRDELRGCRDGLKESQWK